MSRRATAISRWCSRNYALYPHMRVYDNIAFGLRLRELKGALWQLTHLSEARAIKQRIDARVRQVAQMLKSRTCCTACPKSCPGGQRQRVALARAIVRQPKVFLMDEPLSNLDAKLRDQTRAELKKLQERLGVTTIYVTHDPERGDDAGHAHRRNEGTACCSKSARPKRSTSAPRTLSWRPLLVRRR
jgi:ABC-type sugar transport system ATPase subunit